MPKFETIAGDVREQIARGTYVAGDRLPTVAELCAAYDASTTTINRAMDLLEECGLVTRRRGSGTYVIGASDPGAQADAGWSSSGQMMGFTAEHTALGQVVSSVVHDFSIRQPSADVAARLGMGADEFAYHVSRSRLADGTPRALEDMCMPVDVISGLRPQHAEGSIYEFIADACGLAVASAHRTIRAVRPTPEQAALLSVGADEALMQIEQVAFLANGMPFEWSVSLHAPGYEFYSVSHR